MGKGRDAHIPRAIAMLVAMLVGGDIAHSATLPGIGVNDPRVPVDVASAPWTALARLQIPGVDRCTAFLIAPRIALTAAHCLWGARLHHWMPPGSVHVLTGYASGEYSRHSVAASYRIGTGYDPELPYATLGADFAVLALADPLGVRGALLALRAPPTRWGTRITLGGYSQDRAEILLADRNCAVTGDAADETGHALLRHDCTATHGTSGAPLLTREADGTWRVVGIEVGAFIAGSGGAAVPAESVRSLLEGPAARP